MLGEGGTALSKLKKAVREFEACEDRQVDLEGLRKVIDTLKDELAAEERASQLHPHRSIDRVRS